MIFPTTGLHPKVDGATDIEIWEGPSEKFKHSPFRYTFGPFSHRHAATRAGLGEFGFNNIVLTTEFGPRQRFNSIITDAELVPDPLVTEPICLRDKCELCLKACIMQCITMRDDPDVVDYRSVREDDHSRIFIDTPAKTDPTLCRRRRVGKPHSPIRGDCVRVCPIPVLPKRLPTRLLRIVDAWVAGESQG
jgi:epoxyqueuosine reductase QueG